MASLSLIDLISQRSFVDQVHSEVAKMFDDDFGVLFKSLSESLALNSRHLNVLMSQSLDTVYSNRYTQINNSSRFINLPIESIRRRQSEIIDGIEVCENKLFLQIYIPNFETTDLTKTPIVAVGYDDNPQDCIVFGYQLIGDTIHIIDIDSTVASNNLIWFVSLNNVVNNSGELPDSFFKLSDTISVASTINNSEDIQANPRTEMNKQVRIHSIMIARKNRTCWFCGKDPVAVSGFFSEFTWCKPVDNPRGIFTDVLFKVGRKDLNKWINIPTNIWLAQIANPNSPLRKYNEAIEFVMYTNSKRSRHAVTFSCDHPNCPNPLPPGVTATYRTRYNDYGYTSYLPGGHRPLNYYDVPASSGLQMIHFPVYNWYGNQIRFHGSNVAF